MNFSLYDILPAYAHLSKADLDPNWVLAARRENETLTDERALERVAELNGWTPPERISKKPRANAFPLLVHTGAFGWAVAEQWHSRNEIQLFGGGTMAWDDVKLAYRQKLPGAGNLESSETAFAVFRDAFMARKPLIVAAIIATVTINLIAVATSLYSMQVYDRVIPLASYPTLTVLTVGVLGALLLDFLLRSARALLLEREAAEMDVEISEFFFSRAQAIRMDARPPGVGTFAAQFRGLEQVRSLLSFGSLFAVADLPFAAFFVAVIWWIAGPTVALVPIVIFPLSLLLAFLFAWKIRKQSAAAMVTGHQKNGLLVEAFDAAETLKAAHGRWHFAARWSRLVDEVLGQEDSVKTWSAVASSLFAVLSQTSYVLIVCVGAVQAAQNEITIGALIACSILSSRINGPLIGQLPSLIVQASYARSSLALLDGLLALPVEREGAQGVRAESLEGPLELEYCRFAYPGGAAVVDIERLRIEPGETVALIGGIGSGKSTLLRLLAGIYSPTQGAARVGGLDMSQIADEQLRRHMGYLPQDYRLVNGTLRENLVLGLPDPGDEAIIAAARKTGLIHMVTDHPLGLSRPISEGGRGLSGGQRTLTGLTRLFLMQPSVWLLDEPTSNLDATTETRVLQGLQQSMKSGDSFVMVTHKMALLSMVRRVIVLAKGRVWMDGTPHDVLGELKEKAKEQKAIAREQGRISAG
ncbi:hypothetical protein B5C34_10680 [Pacificimonas flava]|uniref:Uncharacterized protein n=2 Tax=Pacificimonas TaxID=1960290 RepID=A0A219B677_9SPHN|nr:MULTISPECIES: ATP-binding cassette domain-containing protein [Pacificimonas]MBZ6378865.1 ATP-binding cassette domain-containing protein [Pacificimonas aurantium]OWV33882.1 hypothetical protein B5C34_10680 [Pacificimonas flava]